MTKERKMAIEMWQNIRSKIIMFGQRLTDLGIQVYKQKFCKEHGLKWELYCWFCQYVVDCNECPLHYCGCGSDYSRVMDNTLDNDTRVEACNNIIKALGGEV